MATFNVYYVRSEFFCDFINGMQRPNVATLAKTHTFIRSIELEAGPGDLDEVYYRSQGEVWSPNGEARDLIRRSGAGHTSMSIGDVITCGGKYWVVASFGFSEFGAEG